MKKVQYNSSGYDFLFKGTSATVNWKCWHFSWESQTLRRNSASVA